MEQAQSPAVVSHNSLRHGLHATSLVIPNLESEADWLDFTADAHAALAPEGAIECALAARIVELLWRLRRAARAEHREIVDQYERACADDEERVRDNIQNRRDMAGTFYESAFDIEPAKISMKLMPRQQVLDQIIRYEAHLSRQLHGAMRELEVLQSRRNGQISPLIRLRMEGGPGS